MKRTIFTVIMILALCVVASAQASENVCQKIIIEVPQNIAPDETFKATANFEKDNQSSTAVFNWTIIKGSEVIKRENIGTIEVDSKDVKDDEIILLVDMPDGKCRNTAMAKIFLVPACGLPYTIDEYSDIPWSDEKARLENVVFQMREFKDTELFAFFSFNKKTSQSERKNYLTKVLNFLSANRGLERNRITFLISESEDKRIYFQPLPKNFSSDVFEDYFVVKGEDFDKLDNLFQPKTATKNSKK